MYKLATNKRRLPAICKFVCVICVVILVGCKGDHGMALCLMICATD